MRLRAPFQSSCRSKITKDEVPCSIALIAISDVCIYVMYRVLCALYAFKLVLCSIFVLGEWRMANDGFGKWFHRRGFCGID